MKFEETEVFNFEGALRGMRNPMESWSNADSVFRGGGKIVSTDDVKRDNFTIGKNDMKLAQRLIKAGTDHRKFMRQIFVCVDITAPLYWWKEFDTYKVGTVANSTSTMHKLASTPITMDCFETKEDVLDAQITISDYVENIADIWTDTIYMLERLRNMFLDTKDKRYWKALIQLLPGSWLQTRTVTFDYENLLSIAHSDRKNHKLTEWCESFFDWMRTLPYAEELIFLDMRRGISKAVTDRLESLSDLVGRECLDFYAITEELDKIINLVKEDQNESITNNR